MTEPTNVTTESGVSADGERDVAESATDVTAAITENGDDAGDADLVPDH
jgi:hypothetical protein